MTGAETGLPGSVPARLLGAYRGLPRDYQEAVRKHLLGGTSADWLSDWFGRYGLPVGATTIKKYRRHLRSEGSV